MRQKPIPIGYALQLQMKLLIKTLLLNCLAGKAIIAPINIVTVSDCGSRV